MFFRLIKPDWGKKEIPDKSSETVKMVPNPKFVREIDGPDTIGDDEMTPEFLGQKNDAGYGIYFFPNHPSKKPEHKFLSGKDIDVFNFVFVDMDLKDKVYPTKEAFVEKLMEFPVRPTMTVDSGNGIHAYWSIKELNRELFIVTQFMLIQHFNTDDSIWTPLQLMRFPGTKNTKNPDNFKAVEYVDGCTSSAEYELDELLSHLPSISPENEKRMLRHVAKLEGRAEVDMDLRSMDDLPEKFVQDMEKNLKLRALFETPREVCGDRSSADMKLANMLFSLDYEKSEALQVLANTQKARSRSDRMGYAFNTVNKVYRDRPKYAVESAAERRAMGTGIKNLGRLMNGPQYWDCLFSRWRTKQVLGLIAGSGVGKTTATLNMFKAFIENNPESDDIFVFFSLEMTEGEIHDEWERLVKGDEASFRRLYVVANEDDDGNPRNIGLQEILWFSRDIQKATGKKIGAIAIDHLDAISKHLDTTKKDTFKFEGFDRESNFRSDVITIGKGTICAKVKELAKKLDVFVILQSQTTKKQDGGGDIAIGKNAAYGVSNFEWYVDYIMTLWRPLKRVQDKTKLRVSAWQYAKIRRQHRDDEVQEGLHYLLKFDMADAVFSELSDQEMEMASQLVREANARRKAEEKNDTTSYHNSPVMKQLKLIFKTKKEGA